MYVRRYNKNIAVTLFLSENYKKKVYEIFLRFINQIIKLFLTIYTVNNVKISISKIKFSSIYYNVYLCKKPIIINFKKK